MAIKWNFLSYSTLPSTGIIETTIMDKTVKSNFLYVNYRNMCARTKKLLLNKIHRNFRKQKLTSPLLRVPHLVLLGLSLHFKNNLITLSSLAISLTRVLYMIVGTKYCLKSFWVISYFPKPPKPGSGFTNRKLCDKGFAK